MSIEFSITSNSNLGSGSARLCITKISKEVYKKHLADIFKGKASENLDTVLIGSNDFMAVTPSSSLTLAQELVKLNFNSNSSLLADALEFRDVDYIIACSEYYNCRADLVGRIKEMSMDSWISSDTYKFIINTSLIDGYLDFLYMKGEEPDSFTFTRFMREHRAKCSK